MNEIKRTNNILGNKKTWCNKCQKIVIKRELTQRMGSMYCKECLKKYYGE